MRYNENAIHFKNIKLAEVQKERGGNETAITKTEGLRNQCK
ncbi:hypothetical protein [Virgibacillus pantothenticus]|nr:hypothetical protein [Virgibacillus pantothenticus]